MSGKKELEQKVMAEAIRIGDWLLDVAIEEGPGLTWETLTMDLERNVGKQKSEGIYSGVSGVVLYLAELSNITGDSRYFEAAKKGMAWVMNHIQEEERDYYALITGRLGIPFVMLRMWKLSGDDYWKEKALELAKPCKAFLAPGNQVDDFINGHSGSIIGLLHLHAATGEEWLLEAIDAFIKRLLEGAHLGNKGMYWDRSFRHISGLCGFSHGVAGIGFVFLELGRYFKNETFYQLAHQAFNYENNNFDKKLNNWPDLRKGIYTDEDDVKHREAVAKNDMDFFTAGGGMNAWCHGAAGIGLARLRAVELLEGEKKEVYMKDVLTAIDKTYQTDVEMDNPAPIYILCHGGGGNAELFIQAYQTLGDEKYMDWARGIADAALASREAKGWYGSGYRDAKGDECTSMFMGNSGVGYFLLRLLKPNDVPSIEAPLLDETFTGSQSLSDYYYIQMSPRQAARELLKNYFRRTVALVEKFEPKWMEKFLEDSLLDTKKDLVIRLFIDFMEKKLVNLTTKELNCINDIFILEREKVVTDLAIISHSFLYARDMVLGDKGKELIELEDKKILELELTLGPDVLIASTDWDWSGDDEEEWLKNMDLEPDVYPLLLKPTPNEVMEEKLSPLSYTILGTFEGGRKVEDARLETIEAFESLNPEQEQMLTGKIIEQIKQALQAAILVPVEDK